MLRVCFPFIGGGIGGSHISAVELIREVPRHGINPLVVVHQQGPLADFLRGEGIRFSLLRWSKFAAGHEPTYSDDKRLAKAARWRFAWYLRRNRIDIVHTNDIRVGCTWLPAAAAGGARFVWHQRTPGSRHTFNHFAARADRIICPSLYVRDRIFENINSAFLKKDFGWAKILCVRNPISLSSTSTTHPGRIDTRSFPRVGLIANDTLGAPHRSLLRQARFVQPRETYLRHPSRDLAPADLAALDGDSEVSLRATARIVAQTKQEGLDLSNLLQGIDIDD